MFFKDFGYNISKLFTILWSIFLIYAYYFTSYFLINDIFKFEYLNNKHLYKEEKIIINEYVKSQNSKFKQYNIIHENENGSLYEKMIKFNEFINLCDKNKFDCEKLEKLSNIFNKYYYSNNSIRIYLKDIKEQEIQNYNSKLSINDYSLRADRFPVNFNSCKVKNCYYELEIK
jgi:hypothetical protein